MSAAIALLRREKGVNWENVVAANIPKEVAEPLSHVEQLHKKKFFEDMHRQSILLFDPTSTSNPSAADLIAKAAKDYVNSLSHLKSHFLTTVRDIPMFLFRGHSFRPETLSEEMALALYNGAVCLYLAALENLRDSGLAVLNLQPKSVVPTALRKDPKAEKAKDAADIEKLRNAYKRLGEALSLLRSVNSVVDVESGKLTTASLQFSQQEGKSAGVPSQASTDSPSAAIATESTNPLQTFQFVSDAERQVSFARAVVRYTLTPYSETGSKLGPMAFNVLARLAMTAAVEPLPTHSSTSWREGPLQLYALALYHTGSYHYASIADSKDPSQSMATALTYLQKAKATLNEETKTPIRSQGESHSYVCVLSALLPTFNSLLDEIRVKDQEWDKENRLVYNGRLLPRSRWAELKDPEPFPAKGAGGTVDALLAPLSFPEAGSQDPFRNWVPHAEVLLAATAAERERTVKLIAARKSLQQMTLEATQTLDQLRARRIAVPKAATTAADDLFRCLEQLGATATRDSGEDATTPTPQLIYQFVEGQIQKAIKLVETTRGVSRLVDELTTRLLGPCITREERGDFIKLEEKINQIRSKLEFSRPMLESFFGRGGAKGLTLDKRKSAALGSLAQGLDIVLTNFATYEAVLVSETTPIPEPASLDSIKARLERLPALLGEVKHFLAQIEASQPQWANLDSQTPAFVMRCKEVSSLLQDSSALVKEIDALHEGLQLELEQLKLAQPAGSAPPIIFVDSPSEEREEAPAGKGKKAAAGKRQPKKGNTNAAAGAVDDRRSEKRRRSPSPSRGARTEEPDDLAEPSPLLQGQPTVLPPWSGSVERGMTGEPSPVPRAAEATVSQPEGVAPAGSRFGTFRVGAGFLAAFKAQAEPKTPEYPPVNKPRRQ
jgi:hypothetical protein